MAGAGLENLNPQQRRAVEHGGSVLAEAGPLLIIAGAGSGKTNTLAHRVAHLIVNGADPRRILLLTFSRRAAAEMTRRVERIVAGGCMRRQRRRHGRRADLGRHVPRASARGCLREYAEQIGLDRRLHDPRSRGFRRPDEPRPARARPLENGEALSDQGHLPCDLFARGQRASSRSRRCCSRLSLVRRLGRPSCRTCSPAYVEAKQRQNVLDYDDLLLYWAQMMQRGRDRRATSAARFDHVLVDEYQDTNRLQASILLALKPGRAGA